MLTKGTKAHQRKVSSAKLIVYTAHFIRAGLDFQDRVPILSVLGLPLHMVRARVKFWSGTDGAKSFTRLNLSVPNKFFCTRTFFIRAVPKIFCRVNGAKDEGNTIWKEKKWENRTMFYTALWSVVNSSLLFWKLHKDEIIDCANCSSSAVVRHEENLVTGIKAPRSLALIYMQIIYFAFSSQVFV